MNFYLKLYQAQACQAREEKEKNWVLVLATKAFLVFPSDLDSNRYRAQDPKGLPVTLATTIEKETRW